MSFSTLETRLLHALVIFDGFLDMVDQKDDLQAGMFLARDVIRDCQAEASGRDGHWKERIGITHNYL